jgi:hypothetical protein
MERVTRNHVYVVKTTSLMYDSVMKRVTRNHVYVVNTTSFMYESVMKRVTRNQKKACIVATDQACDTCEVYDTVSARAVITVTVTVTIFILATHPEGT